MKVIVVSCPNVIIIDLFTYITDAPPSINIVLELHASFTLTALLTQYMIYKQHISKIE